MEIHVNYRLINNDGAFRLFSSACWQSWHSIFRNIPVGKGSIHPSRVKCQRMLDLMSANELLRLSDNFIHFNPLVGRLFVCDDGIVLVQIGLRKISKYILLHAFDFCLVSDEYMFVIVRHPLKNDVCNHTKRR